MTPPSQQISRRDTLKQLAAWSGASLLFWAPRYDQKTAVSQPKFAATGDVNFSWSGAMTLNSIKIIAQLTRTSGQVRLAASLSADLRDPVFSAVAATNGNRLVSLALTSITIMRLKLMA